MIFCRNSYIPWKGKNKFKIKLNKVEMELKFYDTSYRHVVKRLINVLMRIK